MKWKLRGRFIRMSMAALSILILLIMGLVAALGYWQMETMADGMLALLVREQGAEPEAQPAPLPAFGYRVGPSAPGPTRHFTALWDGRQVFSLQCENMAIAQDEAEALVRQVLDAGQSSGKVDSYKYLVRDLGDGLQKLAFLDNAIQAQFLRGLVERFCLAGAALLALMLLILIPLSGRATRPIWESMLRQRQFVTDASHEIKTPLAIMQANAEALELRQGETKWSANIRGQIVRLSGLMQRLLMLARLDEQAPEAWAKVDMSALIQDVADAFCEPFAQRGIGFSCRIQPGLAVRGSAQALEQLATQLLDNALKYASQGGYANLQLSREGRRCCLTVENSVDQLPPVPPQTLFDRFYRADRARSQAGGYGIGLAVAQAIALRHRGKMWATYVGEGTVRFSLELRAMR